jgi:hypothetical protein
LDKEGSLQAAEILEASKNFWYEKKGSPKMNVALTFTTNH